MAGNHIKNATWRIPPATPVWLAALPSPTVALSITSQPIKARGTEPADQTDHKEATWQ